MKNLWLKLKQYLGQTLHQLCSRYSFNKVLMVFSVVALIVGWLIGMFIGSGVFSAVLQDKMALTTELKNLRQDLLERQINVAELEIAHQIDKQSLKNVTETIQDLESDLATNQRELKYYQALMGSYQVASKPFVRDIELYKTEDGEIAYRIVVQQGKTEQGKSSEIKLQVAIKGTTEEGMVSLPLEEFDPSFPSGDNAFSIKYYKLLQGQILLPETFEPSEIVTRTWVEGNKSSSTVNHFDWQPTTPK